MNTNESLFLLFFALISSLFSACLNAVHVLHLLLSGMQFYDGKINPTSFH